ncbi:DUF4041 domain-containing protein [Allobranchiibius sp. CTAmp26]|nr:DUF4041 domain-containing protein [Allobranchiibius sp. CTAmp26]
MRREVAELQAQASAARVAATTARAEERAARADLAQDLNDADVQEAGVYTFNHPLQDAIAYQEALREVQASMKELVRTRSAVLAVTHWTVDGSTAKGTAMVRDFSKLMLRAYNSEADTLIRALRPHTLGSAKGRLDKAAMTIERLGKTMSIRIAPSYHRLRLHELELTADYLVKKQQEKEAERERRAQLRDEAKARVEMEAKLVDLRKEQQHYSHLLERLPDGDEAARADAQAKLQEIHQSIEGVEARAANTRAGHVYVISNVGAFGPDMVKIGMTRRLDPMDRVNELGDASVPFRFDVHALVFHQDAVALETHLHQALAHQKVNQINTRREFFYTTPAEVKVLLHKYAGSYLLEYRDTPEAFEWRSSGAVQRSTPPPAPKGPPAPVLIDAPTPTTSILSQHFPTTAARTHNEETRTPVFEAPPPNGDPSAKAAWYASPHDTAFWRRWDGTAWTHETKPR